MTFTRRLGKNGIEISALGLGGWAIGGVWSGRGGRGQSGWGHVDDAESIRAIKRALDMGVTFLDTADVYGAGHSERIIAEAIAGRRDQVVLATKFGMTFDEEHREVTGTNASPEYIRQACEESLRRLNTDYIDLYQFHLSDYSAEQALDVRDVLEALVAEGKIGGYAWSTDEPDLARVFADGPNCIAIQHQLNVFDDSPQMLGLCDEYDLASICRTPLAMGLLTGKFTADSRLPENDIRHNSPWWDYFQPDKMPMLLEKLDALRQVLTSDGRTLAQGALGWVWARSPRTIPIPGFKTVAQIEDNAGALRFGPLSSAQMQQIEGLLGR